MASSDVTSISCVPPPARPTPLQSDLPQTPDGAPSPVLQDAMRRLIDDMHGNEAAAARALGVRVQTLRAWLE